MSCVRFRNALTGDEILLPHHICRKVQERFTVEWFFPFLASVLECPWHFIRLVATGAGVDGDSRVLEGSSLSSKRSQTFLTSLQQEAEADIWVAVVPVPAPSDHSQLAYQGFCICDFGGCCRRCSVPGCNCCEINNITAA